MAASRTAASGRVKPSPLGELLRHWRAARRLSQFALALEASTTARHLSFIESGRSQPSAEMVLRLARALDVPIRERNQLLLAAGYAPVYREAGLDGEHAAHVRAALERMLGAHEPFPAVVMDRHWNLLGANRAADAFFGWLLDEREPEEPANVVKLMFDPNGIRPFVTNWHAALSYFSTVTTLGTPQDAMLQEIRVESFFPADDATAAHAWSGR